MNFEYHTQKKKKRKFNNEFHLEKIKICDINRTRIILKIIRRNFKREKV